VDRSKVDWHCRTRDLFEEVLPQDDARSPRWLSWEQQS
jgi:hypothetical protein